MMGRLVSQVAVSQRATGLHYFGIFCVVFLTCLSLMLCFLSWHRKQNYVQIPSVYVEVLSPGIECSI